MQKKELKKENWLKEIQMIEHPEPIKYFYIIDHCTFSFSANHIKKSSLEELKAEYEDNKNRLKKFKDNGTIGRTM